MKTVMSYTIPHPMQICNYYSKDALSHLINGTIELAIIRDFLPTPGIWNAASTWSCTT